jgi:succinyl-diaminopimelate desuccinylase
MTEILATDPIALSQALIRCASVTPKDDGALGLVQRALQGLGFSCTRLPFAEVDNLYAVYGGARPNFCFAGHTDVVPPGDVSLWRHPPFEGQVVDGVLHGRGASDMKTGIAAFIAAFARLRAKGWQPKGQVSLLITGDEEGPSVNGTKKVLGWLKENGHALDHALVGEPTGVAEAGDTIKIGRRGSMNVRLTVAGAQGHTAYPQNARNPVPAMAEIVTRLAKLELDKGSDHFEPSTLAFTTIDTGNPATNVIPARLNAGFNIRFNDLHTPETLKAKIAAVTSDVARASGCEAHMDVDVSGVSFVTKLDAYTALLADAVSAVRGMPPEFSTGGGTSDARFIKDFCPVVEMGLAGATMHKTDECVPVADVGKLTAIYEKVLELYFQRLAA